MLFFFRAMNKKGFLLPNCLNLSKKLSSVYYLGIALYGKQEKTWIFLQQFLLVLRCILNFYEEGVGLIMYLLSGPSPDDLDDHEELNCHL